MVSSPQFSISYPYAITMNKGKLFVADLKNVYRAACASGNLTLESSIGHVASECHLASDHLGQFVYLSSYQEIFRINCNTLEMQELRYRIMDKPEGYKFGCIKGIVLDKHDKNMYVVDGSRRRLYVVDMNTLEANAITEKLTHPGAVTMDKQGFLYMIEARTIIKLAPPRLEWKAERLLWIGNRKNEAQDCPLARLPPEIIREIVKSF